VYWLAHMLGLRNSVCPYPSQQAAKQFRRVNGFLHAPLIQLDPRHNPEHTTTTVYNFLTWDYRLETVATGVRCQY
jgi:hypothetical protein